MRTGAAFAPPTRPSLGRPRLLEQLAPVESRGLAVLVAPAGFGKTTLLGQWSMTRNRVVRWCDPANLPGPGALLDERSSRGGLGGVVIDDVPEDQDPVHQAHLERLIQEVAPSVPVLLAARRLPTITLARHEFSTSTIVTDTDLTFRPWEVAALFADVYEDPLRDEEPLSITDWTGGWPATLRLLHLARRMGDHGDEPDQPAALEGLVRAYLDRQVLAALNGHSRRLLRASSVFDVVTAERMDLLLGIHDSHRMLDRIARRVSLVSVSGSFAEGPRYTVHPVLRRHLRSLLAQELGVRRMRQLYERAAVVAERHGDLTGAFAARCRAHNERGLATMLAEHGPALLPMTAGMLDLVTPALSAGEPSIRLARARLLLADGRTREAHREAEQALPHLTGDDGSECHAIATRATGLPPPAMMDARASNSECLRLLGQGRLRQARAVLAGFAVPVPAGQPTRLAAELALASVDALSQPHGPLGDFERVHDAIRRQGSGWLRRMAYTVALCRGGDPRRCAEALSLATEREGLGDAWGAALVQAVVAFALMRRGHPDVALLERLSDRFRLLGAPTLEAWARSALALALSTRDVPDSDAAASAEAFARAADAPGPLALAYAALALADPRRTGELLALARSTARSAGFSVRPWTWARDASARPRQERPVQPPPITAPASRGGRADSARTRPRPAAHPVSWGGLSLTCFGQFTVTVDSRSASLPVRPMALTVLRILAIHAGSAVHRSVFIEALWANLGEAAAQHNLHVAVSSLRQGLEPIVPDGSHQLVARQGQGYALAPGGEPVTDLQRLDLRLAEATQSRRAGDITGQVAALRAALDLYTGEVLPGDGAAEWVLATRDGYRLAAAGTAAQLAELELGRNHVGTAIVAAQRSVQIDPYRDASWRLLITAHLKAGQPAEAERAKQDYAAVLDSLGIRTMPPGSSDGASDRTRASWPDGDDRNPGIRTA